MDEPLTPDTFRRTWFPNLKTKWTEKGYVVDGLINLSEYTDDTELPFPFCRVFGNFEVHFNPRLKTTRNFPKEIGWMLTLQGSAITDFTGFPRVIADSCHLPAGMSFYECRKLLLVDCPRFTFSSAQGSSGTKASRIINDGRVDGVMPSELIPGKIAQLKELNKWDSPYD